MTSNRMSNRENITLQSLKSVWNTMWTLISLGSKDWMLSSINMIGRLNMIWLKRSKTRTLRRYSSQSWILDKSLTLRNVLTKDAVHWNSSMNWSLISGYQLTRVRWQSVRIKMRLSLNYWWLCLVCLSRKSQNSSTLQRKCDWTICICAWNSIIRGLLIHLRISSIIW